MKPKYNYIIKGVKPGNKNLKFITSVSSYKLAYSKSQEFLKNEKYWRLEIHRTERVKCLKFKKRNTC